MKNIRSKWVNGVCHGFLAFIATRVIVSKKRNDLLIKDGS